MLVPLGELFSNENAPFLWKGNLIKFFFSLSIPHLPKQITNMCPFNQLEKTNISKTHKDHTSTKSQPEHNTLKNLITVIAAKITVTLYTSPQSLFPNFRKIPITHPISFPKNIKKEQPPHSSTNPRHTANLPLTAQIIPQPPPHKLRTKNGQQRSCFPFFLSPFNLQSRSLPKSRKIPLSRPHYECALR